MTHVAQTRMAVHNLYTFSDEDVSKDWPEGEDGGKGGLPVDDQERNMIYFEAVRKVSYAGTARIGVSNDHDFMSSIDELGR